MTFEPAAPAPIAAESCVLCGTPLAVGAERCPNCDLWVGVDDPAHSSRIPRNALVGMALGIAAVWVVTLVVAAVVG